VVAFVLVVENVVNVANAALLKCANSGYCNGQDCSDCGI
jgi:hypothetical protein